MRAPKTKIEYLASIIFLIALTFSANKYYKFHQKKQSIKLEQIKIEACNKKIARADEVADTLNQIAYYKRNIRLHENELRSYRDELYKMTKEINEDIYVSRNSPHASCPIGGITYDDLQENLVHCEKQVRQLYDIFLKEKGDCISEKIRRQARHISEQLKQLEINLE